MSQPATDKEPRELTVGALVVFAVWTLYGLLLLTQMLINRGPGYRPPWKPYGPALYWMSYAWTWAVFTPLIATLFRRVRPALRRPQTILVHLLGIAAMQAVITIVDAATFYFVSRQLPESIFRGYTRGFTGTVLLYCAVCLAVAALDHARVARARAIRATQLESDLTRARLETLRRQIQPHFLFNTLNTISELIDSDPPRAGVMVTRLGDLLRRSLEENDRTLISLDAELEFIRLYTEIERVRFESWLDVVEEIDPITRGAHVPSMILQPLVENAIKHGISPLKRKGIITIRASRTDPDRLRVEVIDDGIGVQSNGKGGWGIGLSTARERLAHIFGNDATLTVESQTESGTRVTLDLPFVRQAY